MLSHEAIITTLKINHNKLQKLIYNKLDAAL
jgi:hypothetical protein